jgi:hypothetical protein
MRPEERELYQRHRFTLDVQTSWKSYPIRIVAPNESRCHRRPSLLVQDSESASFVQGLCTAPGCGRLTTLTQNGFEGLNLWVTCPRCNRRMRSELPVSGYGFSCDSCRIYIPLVDLVPRYDDALALVSHRR